MGRTERGTAAPRRERRVRPIVGAVLVVALIVAGFVSFPWLRDRWNDWTHELRDRAATLPELRLEEQRTLAGSESMLIVLTDEAQRGVAFALLSRAGDEPATLVLVPAALYDILPGYGDFPLADATVFEGPELARLTVSNMLGVRIDRVMALGPGDFAAAVGSDLEVTLASPLIVEEPGGTPVRVAAEGTLSRPPEVVETIMSTPGTSGAFDWLERQAAVWEALMAAMEHDPELTDRLAGFAGTGTETATGILARAAAGDVQVTLLPVVAVSAAGVEDGFKVDPEAASGFVSSRLGHLLLAEGERPRVEILNGNGRILTTRTVA
ncbi:MAG: hypothetical protein PVI35_07690, partial [Acidimicrobiia bacterium]